MAQSYDYGAASSKRNYQFSTITRNQSTLPFPGQNNCETSKSNRYQRQTSLQHDTNSPSSRDSSDSTTTAAANNINSSQKCASQFNPASFDTQSMRSRRTLSTNIRCGSCLSLNQQEIAFHNDAGALVVYDPKQTQLIRANDSTSRTAANYGETNKYIPIPPPFPPPPPFWFLPPPPMYFSNGRMPMPSPMCFGNGPLQSPPDLKLFRKAMKLEKKKMEAERKFNLQPNKFVRFCCGEVAQILWIIIAITCFGLLIALVLALYVI